jgi:hypothetical protein
MGCVAPGERERERERERKKRRNISDKYGREHQITHFTFYIPFPKIMPFIR